ncbi:helix-turn-helix domain-containing protein [Mediterraneibacter agrestimuris]|uniref:helix-turn-helix domain-containing protein n=1 Tax=Mediterraneibacter agrestimuris TaxID=2941333 RepID=UPI00203C3C81|nr:helix-turn-helix domain-containing protein [Mediterraneibacter agrestimuris]
MSFPENLKKLRIKENISQQELAQKIGVSQTAIYQWEKGTRTPKIDAIAKLANVLHVTPAHLFMTEKDGDDVIEVTIPDISGNNIKDYLNVILPEYIEECRKEQELYNSIDKKNTILKKLDELNSLGQDKAIEQVELLTKIPEYRRDE